MHNNANGWFAKQWVNESDEWMRSLGDFLYIGICSRGCYWVFWMRANLVYLLFFRQLPPRILLLNMFFFLEDGDGLTSNKFSSEWNPFFLVVYFSFLEGFSIYAELLSPLPILREPAAGKRKYFLLLLKLCYFLFLHQPDIVTVCYNIYHNIL